MFMLQLHDLRNHERAFSVVPYDEVFVSTLRVASEFGVFLKLTLPRPEARAVLAGLAAANVTAGSLFPGLWGVAREFHEQRLAVEDRATSPRSDIAKYVATRVTELMKVAGA